MRDKCPTWKIALHYYDKWGECYSIVVGCACRGVVTDKRKVNDVGNFVCKRRLSLEEANRRLNNEG